MPDRVAIIRTSDRQLFKRCRRKWGWGSGLRQNLKIKDSPSYFWIGTGGHFALEDYHGHNHYQHPVEAFRAYVEACRLFNSKHGFGLPADWEEQKTLGEGILEYYLIWASERDTYKTVWIDGEPQVEVKCQIDLTPYIGPELLKASGYDKVIYQLTLDRLVEIEGEYWILDWKFYKSFGSGALEYDQQMCVPLNTEILTRTGWKHHDQLIIGKEVLGYNKEHKQLEWCTLQDIHLSGIQDTVTYSNKSFEFTSTPQHKWVQGHYTNKNQRGQNHEAKITLEPIVAGKHNIYTVMSAHLDAPTLSLSPNEARVVAWLLTDGSFGAYERGLRASICQSKRKYANNIQELLDTFTDAYTRVRERDDTVTWHLSMDFFRGLWAKAGLEFDLTGWEKFVLGLSDEARRAFCDAAMQAEGHKKQFYQNRGTKQDLFKLAFFLSGHFPTRGKPSGKGVGGFKNSGTCEVFTLGTPHKWNTTIREAKGTRLEVWCPQTSLGTWVMRQNGQMTITGNSAYIWGAATIFEKPIAGAILHEFLKKLAQPPRVLSTGKLSTAEKQGTTHRLYREALIEVYGNVQKATHKHRDRLNDLAARETEDRDDFIKRAKTRRTPLQQQAEGTKILMEIEDMINPNLPLYTNATRDCNWDCSLQDICLMIDRDDDWAHQLNDITAQRDEEFDQWRQHLVA